MRASAEREVRTLGALLEDVKALACRGLAPCASTITRLHKTADSQGLLPRLRRLLDGKANRFERTGNSENRSSSRISKKNVLNFSRVHRVGARRKSAGGRTYCLFDGGGGSPG